MSEVHRREVLDLPHEFKGDAEVISEVEVLYHVDDVVLVVSVLATSHMTYHHMRTQTN